MGEGQRDDACGLDAYDVQSAEGGLEADKR